MSKESATAVTFRTETEEDVNMAKRLATKGSDKITAVLDVSTIEFLRKQDPHNFLPFPAVEVSDSRFRSFTYTVHCAEKV